MGLILQNVSNSILCDVSLEVSNQELLVIIGPTGAGKSSLLKTIVGLLPVQQGKIYLDNRNITFVAPHLRQIAMLFQNHILFPHKTTQENIEFGLKAKKRPTSEIKEKSKEIANMLGLLPLLSRYPDTLSGGERQRVALAQILLLNPNLLLLDEPLTHLDQVSQVQLRRYIEGIHQALSIPIIYITHNQNEARNIATKLGVLMEGKIQQIHTPSHIYQNPANPNIAQFLGLL